MPRKRRTRLSKEHQRHLEQRSFWYRQRKFKRERDGTGNFPPDMPSESGESEPSIPLAHMDMMRRLTGPTVKDALDGLTKDEVAQLDITKFPQPMRWRPYSVRLEDGSLALRFRVRPKHWGQRSGGAPVEQNPEDVPEGISLIVQVRQC